MKTIKQQNIKTRKKSIRGGVSEEIMLLPYKANYAFRDDKLYYYTDNEYNYTSAILPD